MFEDSLISCGNSSLRQRGWPAVASFAIQASFVAALIVVPMLFTDALPLRVIKVAEIPAPPGPTQPEAIASTPRTRQQPTIPREVIQVPPSIPRGVIQVVDPPSVNASSSESGQSASIGVGTGDRNSQIADLFNFGRTITPSVAPPPNKRWRVSGGVEQGLLIQGVKPVYPALARQTGIQGEVILQAVIWQRRKNRKPASYQWQSLSGESRAGGCSTVAIPPVSSEWRTS